ncbi:DedA family protein [Brevibacillus sp. B_LB10_24]|uniref:DedA family protein n=1 Tax=Brevibacillus sp. B_LB10_24 TaxID=3380645 RepID=UPI0038BC6EAF
MLESVTAWFQGYGYWVLFIGLLLEYIALPFPGQLAMSYAGFLTYQGQLHGAVCVLAAVSGTILGSTFSYCVGRKFGSPFFEKYGSRFLLGPKKLAKASRWFEKYGNKVMFIAFFVPGLRHFTGYIAGILNIRFRVYALYSYSGALVWVLTFVTLGNKLGPNWKLIQSASAHSLTRSILLGCAAFILLWQCVKYRHELHRLSKQALQRLREYLKN